jgi:hypothetical protein
VWEPVATALTSEEIEEMEHERSYEKVPPEDLHHIQAEFRESFNLTDEELPWLDQTASVEDGWDASGEEDSDDWESMGDDKSEDEDDDGDAEVSRKYVDSSHAYEWTRALSGAWKMPLKASWDDYWVDGMAMTVRDYFERGPKKPRELNSDYPHCKKHGGDDSLHSSDWGETTESGGPEDDSPWGLSNSEFQNRLRSLQEKSCAWHTEPAPKEQRETC